MNPEGEFQTKWTEILGVPAGKHFFPQVITEDGMVRQYRYEDGKTIVYETFNGITTTRPLYVFEDIHGITKYAREFTWVDPYTKGTSMHPSEQRIISGSANIVADYIGQSEYYSVDLYGALGVAQLNNPDLTTVQVREILVPLCKKIDPWDGPRFIVHIDKTSLVKKSDLFGQDKPLGVYYTNLYKYYNKIKECL